MLIEEAVRVAAKAARDREAEERAGQIEGTPEYLMRRHAELTAMKEAGNGVR